MASALQLSLSATHTPATGLPVSMSISGITLTPAGDGHAQARYTTNSTGGTDQAIPFGSVTISTGMTLFLYNRSLTDSMDISSNTGGSFAANLRETVPVGGFTVLHPGAQYYIKCATASQPYDMLLVQA